MMNSLALVSSLPCTKYPCLSHFKTSNQLENISKVLYSKGYFGYKTISRRLSKTALSSSTRCSSATAERTTDHALVNREDFPILKQIIHEKPLIYFDSAATSQKPKVVLDALCNYYQHDNANVHRGAHSLSMRATEAYEQARQLVQWFIGAESREQVIFTRNATEAINLVAYSWALHNLRSGDEIVLAVSNHHSNIVPWQLVAARTGAVLRYVGLNENQEYDIQQLKKLLESNRVRLVACSHVSNVLGYVNDVKTIAKLAHDVNALVLVDACQSVPHMSVNVNDLDCDFLVASGHKMCGPTGIGFLYGKLSILENMPPMLGGGEMIADVFDNYSTFATLPHKFEAGTPAIAEAIALGAAVTYLNQVGREAIHTYENTLASYLYSQLGQVPNITIFGPKDVSKRAALCSFYIKDIHPSDLAAVLDLEGVAIRSGHHCAQLLHRYLGVVGSARASLYLYNTKEEIDSFIGALSNAIDMLK